MIPAKWRTLDPKSSRQLAIMLTGGGTAIIWSIIDPEGWEPFVKILAFWWVFVPIFIAKVVIDQALMSWFGRRKANGDIEEYVDQKQERLDRIEAAINRLHDYVQEIDPDLEEEFRLEQEFMSGNGGMFAGMNHMEYIRNRKKAGKRTSFTSIWYDFPDNTENQ